MIINPKLPVNFFSHDNSLRSPSEIKRFWDKPFILTEDYRPDTYSAYLERCFEGFPIITEEEFCTVHERIKKNWFAYYPSGTAYRVHCLDGGAWDRPTSWGSFGTLEEASACCANGPVWRKGVKSLDLPALQTENADH
jgi:hypothetical protein